MGTHRECAKWCSTFICGFACVCWVALFSGKKQNVVEYFHMCVCIWSIHHIRKKKHILLTRAQSLTWLLMWNWNIYNHWCMIKCTDIRYIVNKLSFFFFLIYTTWREKSGNLDEIDWAILLFKMQATFWKMFAKTT